MTDLTERSVIGSGGIALPLSGPRGVQSRVHMEPQTTGAWTPMWIIGTTVILLIVGWMMAPKLSSSSGAAYGTHEAVRRDRA
jgi:hypothetical protein